MVPFQLVMVPLSKALGLSLGMSFEPDLLDAPKEDNSALLTR